MEDSQNIEGFALLDAFLTNKELPIREFYIAQYPKTKYYILKNGGTLENAEDAFQEAYLACWIKLNTGKFKPKNKLEIEAYLFTCAKNKWVDQRRLLGKRKRIAIDNKTLHIVGEETSQINEMEKKETQLFITWCAFESLGQSCKNLLTQFYFDKMSLRDIAESLDMTEASTKNKKYRCIQKLKELALKNYTK